LVYLYRGSEETSRFTQIGWARTRKVGCGGVSFWVEDNHKFTNVLVCNYGPGINELTLATLELKLHEDYDRLLKVLAFDVKLI
jgi:hypothetical protein